MDQKRIKPRTDRGTERRDDEPQEIDDDVYESVFSMPKLDSNGHYTNKDYKPDPNDVDSWQRKNEPTPVDLRPARVIKKLQEFFETDVQWEYIRCWDCNKVMGQRQQRIELVQVGGNAVVYCLPDRIRCLDCRDKAKGKSHEKSG